MLGKTWGEAMSSLTHHLQVWKVNCLFKAVASCFFDCMQWLPPFGLIQPWTREKAAWINHKSTAADSTINCNWFQIDLQLFQAEINHWLIQLGKGTHRELDQWPKLTKFLADSSSNQQPWLFRWSCGDLPLSATACLPRLLFGYAVNTFYLSGKSGTPGPITACSPS